MASTYSSLKIQLMATGENSGTWGNVTNTNLGTAIEEAIVGSADVTFSSADVTLTLTDTNATQTARNLRLNLTGTVAAPQNLIVPAIEKVYIVNNTLSFAITVKNATGTGIAVPAGKTMWVYNNATNVVDAVTHLTSLTLGSALPIASGGTGSTSTTYCNLQTNVTGILPNGNTTASSSNGASTIVARDASGNFSANIVTANGSALTSLNASNLASGTVPDARFPATLPAVSGTNLTNLNASNISSGTIANARTTAASANGASTIVARDASGNFTANTGTFTTVTGAGSGITSLNASNLASGTVPDARFPATLPAISGANLTNLNATAITTGTLNNDRTTASSSNGASTIVARDASGNFTANQISVTTIPTNVNFSSTGAITAPVGTTAQRPSPVTGMLRFNSTGTSFEGYNGSGWSSLGGAQGGVGNPFVYENDITVTADYTLTSGKNGMSAGPITIDSGATVTVPDGSTWTIV